MADETLSLSERAIAAIMCRLSEIRKANGYRTDAGLRVFDSRSVSKSDCPCIVVWDGEETPTGAAGNNTSFTVVQTYQVQCVTTADQNATGSELRKIKADAKRAMMLWTGRLDIGEGKNAGMVTYLGARSAPREDGAETEGVELTFSVTFKEAYGDPYAIR